VSHIAEEIPAHLRAEADAVRAWLSAQQGSAFEVTGIVDPDAAAPVASGPSSRELQLILCGVRDGQDVCLRERFRVSRANGGFDVALLRDETPAVGSPAPLLDPPIGVRAWWFDEVLPKHAFTVLLFYRSFW